MEIFDYSRAQRNYTRTAQRKWADAAVKLIHPIPDHDFGQHSRLCTSEQCISPTVSYVETSEDEGSDGEEIEIQTAQTNNPRTTKYCYVSEDVKRMTPKKVI